MAAAIEREFSVQPVLQDGHGGIFEVTVDGGLVFTNRSQCGPLPQPDEILRLIRSD